ncbi:MAG: glycoside hydrolase family 26 protein, partial [Candidatus Omnitrophica bacterium]|nr:glycoside hydrolase family 26 protein [Candidatus Omnitrophota bacterium]
MRLFYKAAVVILVLSTVISVSSCNASRQQGEQTCLAGFFLGDNPSWHELNAFREDFGKKPSLIMVFAEWGSYVPDKTVRDVYSAGARLMVTWEPWRAAAQEAIDYDGLIAGKYDNYILDFALRLKNIRRDLYLRFAHEMNGDWYPWSAARIGSEKYIAIYRHIRKLFDNAGVDNV